MADYDLGTAQGRIVITYDGTGAKEAKESLKDVGIEGKGIGDETAKGAEMLESAMGKAKKAAAVATAAVVGTGAAILKMGFDRAIAIENAEAKMRGLGFSTQQVEGIMTNALAAVKGTAYGLDEAATLAATAVAAGIQPGEALERQLSLVVNASAAAGVSMGEMGDIMRKVWTGGNITNDILDQLQSRGIPIISKLADHYGVSGEKLREMVREGKVNMEDFNTVMEGTVGVVAKEMGGTFTGSFANAKAALSRLGAGVATELLPHLVEFLEIIMNLADEIGEKFGPTLADIAGTLGEALVNGLKSAVDFLGKMVGFIRDNQTWLVPLVAVLGTFAITLITVVKAIKTFQAIVLMAKTAMLLFNASLYANPIVLIIAAIVALVAGLIYFFTQTETGRRIWSSFIDWLKSAWETVRDFFVNLWDTITSAVTTAWNGIKDFLTSTWESISSTVTSVWNAIVAFFTTIWNVIVAVITAYLTTIWTIISTVLNTIRAIWEAIWGIFGPLIKAVWDLIMAIIEVAVAWISKIISTYLNAIKAFWTAIWNAISAVISTVWNAIKSVVTTVINAVKTVITNVWNAIKSATTSVWNAIKSAVEGPINSARNTVSSVVNAIKSAISTAFNAAKTVATNAFNALRDAVSTAINSALTIVRDVVGKIRGVFDGAKTWLLQAGKNIIQGLIDGIKAMVGKVTDAITGVTDKIRGFLPGSPIKEGPLRKHGWNEGRPGKLLVEFLADGIADSIKKIPLAFEGIADMPEYKGALPPVSFMPNLAYAGAGSDVMPPETKSTQVDVTIDVDDLKGLQTIEEFVEMIEVRVGMEGDD